MKIIKKIVSVVFWIGIWAIAAIIVNSSFILPSPIETILRLFALGQTSAFWYSCLISIIRVIVGFACGLFLGIIFGYASFKSDLIKTLMSPFVSLVKATPIASFIILLLLWVGRFYVPSISAMLIVFPVVLNNTLQSLNSIDKYLLEAAEINGASEIQKIKYVYFPLSRDSLISTATTSLGMSWKAAIAAETLINAGTCIGRYIYESKLYLETVDLFAWTLALITISMVFDFLIVFISKSHFINKKKSDF